ncbi:REP-associated tyrosine transposase [Planctobacterium marinum]|uniref:Transposase n=1 Tax=Planctobacterium marinum TaxID=1631968 RepID=A0AA48HIF4_9ALTE|nr:transposase [Planctobacterium marinum]
MTINDLRKGRYSVLEQDYFVTFTTLKRMPVMLNHEVALTICQAIHIETKFTTLAWVVMPDHVHLLLTLKSGTLGEAMQSIKGRSSREVGTIMPNFKWAKGYYEHALRHEECRKQIARYIVANPLRADLVTDIGQYPWWDACYL